MAGGKLVLGALIVFPVFAQFQSIVPSKSTDPFATPGDPHFVLYADLPSPLPNVVAAYSSLNRAGRLASSGHRCFYDAAAHLYFGYDIVIQPEEAIDSWPAIDKTGIAGTFNFHLDGSVRELFPGGKGGGPDDPATAPGTAIFTAIQKFGLKFERANGPGEFLVIDRVGRPSEN